MRSIHDPAGRTLLGRPRHARPLVLWLITAAVLAGCGGLEPVEPYSPISDPAALFMSLTLDHRAINLAVVEPYSELQLTATPRDARGEPMSGLPAPTFRSSDTTMAWVTPDGLLQARQPGNNIKVIAELVADGNIRHADTATVNVTPSTSPPMLDRLSIEPLGGTTEWPLIPNQSVAGQLLFLLASGRSFQPGLTVEVLDAMGTPMEGLALEYESLDPEIATVDPTSGSVSTKQPGEARIVVRTTAYGATKADTMAFTVTLPVIHGVAIQPGANNGPPTVEPKGVVIRPGGYVFWINQSADSVNVIFDDPASAAQIEDICAGIGSIFPVYCDSGNIPPFMSETNNVLESVRGRQFTEPGSYTFHIEPLGVTGRVTVSETQP